MSDTSKLLREAAGFFSNYSNLNEIGQARLDEECDDLIARMSFAADTLAAAQAEPVALTSEAVLGAIARGWCHPANASKEVDSDLATAITEEIMSINTAPPAATQADEASAKDAWQPIETAPRDGSYYILAANGHGVWIARWSPIAVSGYRFEQPWRTCMLNHDHIDKDVRYSPPTHWMPLPIPPDAASQQGDDRG